MRMVLLVVLLVTCSGCVVWYKDFPRPAVTAGQQGRTDAALPAHPGFEQCVFQSAFYEGVSGVRGRVFERSRGEGGPLFLLGEPTNTSVWSSIRMQVPVQGGEVVFVDHPHETGVMSLEGLVCTALIIITPTRTSFLEILYRIASGMTLGVVPWLGVPDTLKFSVTFSVTNRQGVMRDYPYSFRKAGISGLSVLPFAWLNFFTSTEQEAFQAVFQQFLFDAQRDRERH